MWKLKVNEKVSEKWLKLKTEDRRGDNIIEIENWKVKIKIENEIWNKNINIKVKNVT